MSPKREGAAVAYAILIMKDGPNFPVDWKAQNKLVKEEFGDKGFLAIKKRAWQHVVANLKQAKLIYS